MMSGDEATKLAGSYWDERAEQLSRVPPRTRWWDDETTRRHINALVAGTPIDGVHAGFHRRIADLLNGHTAERAVSIGCGMATKEMDLLAMGAVRHFDLYEISASSVELGKKIAAERGLIDRLTFHLANAFEVPPHAGYDVVYWNNALHHMPDVYDALSWSRAMLKEGGLLALDDYVGPSRFQWTDTNLRWANKIRSSLPERLLRNPYEPTALVPVEIARPTPESVIAVDPSEAMDSGRTIGALRHIFGEVEVIPTGGALYHLALNDIFWNFKTPEDLDHLKQILLSDQILAESGTTQYAVAFAHKESAPIPRTSNQRWASVKKILKGR